MHEMAQAGGQMRIHDRAAALLIELRF